VSSFRPDIWRLQANGDIQGLILALEADDSALRRRAAAALRALSAVEAIPSLKRVLDAESDPETRSSVLTALASLEMALRGAPEEAFLPARATRPTPQSQAIEALVLELSSREPKKVVTAALKLAKLKDMRAVETLVVQFNNPQVPARARLLIAEALLELDSAPGDVTVLGALRHAKPSIRRSAAAVLGQMQADWAVDPLAQALQDEDESVREAARTALQAINTADARAALAADTKQSSKASSSHPMPETSAETTESLNPVIGPSNGLLRYIQSETDQQDGVSASTEEPLPDDLGKLTWPKREPSPEQHISNMPTRPLDPRRLEEAKDRLESQGSEPE
jgi:hypothetical protein